MIASAIGELGRSNINDALTSTARNLMYETNQVLVRIAESHTTAYTTLEE